MNTEHIAESGYWDISKLKNWDANPRGILKDDFERLKRQIVKHGQIKPILIQADGTVLGGNMRLRAYVDLGIKNVWVSIIKPGEDIVGVALADNDRAGYYEKDALIELALSVPEFDLNDYNVDLGKNVSLKSLLDDLGPSEDMPKTLLPDFEADNIMRAVLRFMGNKTDIEKLVLETGASLTLCKKLDTWRTKLIIERGKETTAWKVRPVAQDGEPV